MKAARKPLTPVASARMQQAMQNGACSLDELVAISGLSKPVVTKYVRELQALQMVHVAGWADDARGYPTIRKYSWGQQFDAPCPKKYNNDAERMRLARAEKKASAA